MPPILAAAAPEQGIMSIQRCKQGPGWDEAIEYAERKLESVEKQLSQLRSAIETFRRNKEQGLPWPSSETRS